MNEELTRTAYHEGSHALAAYLLGAEVAVISITPGKAYRGITFYWPEAHVDPVAGIVGRRDDATLLGKWGLIPVTLFEPEKRRASEISVMVSLAGRLGEFLAPVSPRTGFIDPSDEFVAERLSSDQAAALAMAQERDHVAKDTDAASEGASMLVNDAQTAAALLRWLEFETRRIVFSDLFGRCLPPIADALLRSTDLPGEAVGRFVSKTLGRNEKPRPTLQLVALD